MQKRLLFRSFIILLSLIFIFTLLPSSVVKAQSTTFNVEYFNNMSMVGTPVFTRTETSIDHNWGTGSPDSSIPVDQFSARWSGQVYFEEGSYLFSTRSDDGIRLKIDGVTVIDRMVDQAFTENRALKTMTAGNHSVVVEYYENAFGAAVLVDWKKATPDSATGFRVMPLGDSITHGHTVSGGYRTKLKSLIPELNFVGTWQDGDSLADKDHEGHPGWRTDELLANLSPWVESHQPDIVLLKAGTNDMGQNYNLSQAPQRLSAMIDTIAARQPNADILVASLIPINHYDYQQRVDAYNAQIPGIVDQKRQQGKKVHYVPMHNAVGINDMPDGVHPNQAGYDAMAQVWATAIHQVRNTQPSNSPSPTTSPTPTSIPNDAYQAEYFNNITLSGSPVVTTQINNLNFDWGYGSPDPLIQSDYFSARWSTVESFAASNYDFTVTADDGVRLYIDGQLVINKWVDQPPTTYTITKAMTEGQHTIVMEYYEKQVGAVAKLSIALQDGAPTPTPTVSPSPSVPLDNGFQALYFNNIQLTGTPVFSKIEEAVYFDWGLSSPHSSVSEDYFSARYTGDITFDPNNYTFSVTADDGVRLFIDDELIIDKWVDQPPTTYTFNKELDGVHRVRVEYYEKTYGAVAKLAWQVASASPTPAPTETGQSTDDGNGTFSAQFFNNLTLEGSPAYSFTTNYIAYGWGYGSPDQSVQTDNFSGRFIGSPEFENGMYRFRVIADDGIKIWINNELVLDQWQDQAQTFEFDQQMEAGEHTIKVEYYEKGIGAALDIIWEKIL